MIKIGLAGWGDQNDLYPEKTAAREMPSSSLYYFSVLGCR